MAKAKKTLTSIRRIVQGAVILFFIYVTWTTREPLQFFINAKKLFQIDPLIMIFTSIAERLLIPGIVLALATLLITFVFGRVFCGWFCPLGSTFDFWAWITSKLRRKRENEPGRMRNIKYLMLLVLLLFSLAGVQLVWFFDPITIFVRSFSFNIHPFINDGLDGLIAFIIRFSNYQETIQIIYYKMKGSLLAISNPVFPHSGYILLVLIILLLLVFAKRRFWCRFICPLGATLALFAKFSLFRRRFSCAEVCGSCKDVCRMNAIKTDNSYIPEECILCMDCIDFCPQLTSTFTFTKMPARPKEDKKTAEGSISRTQFLSWLGWGLIFLTGSKSLTKKFTGKVYVIRPPAALPEREFVQRCVRCGNCMKICPTNVLQPSLLESGFSGIWTPRFNTKIGYCEFKCNLCGRVCPTDAIKTISVEEKMKTKMGLAVIDKTLCLPWAKEQECIVCQEHCPVSSKAIKLTELKLSNGKILKQPSIDSNLCVGCAICENKCPVDPVRAVRVRPLNDSR